MSGLNTFKQQLENIINITVHFSTEPLYTVFAYGFIMNFKNESHYLDWADMIMEGKE